MDYRNGNWYGNSSKSGYENFLDVTHNISDIIENFRVAFKSRSDYASSFKTRDLGDFLYGRCFEIEIEKGNESVDHIKVTTRKPVEMYINLPHIFYSHSEKLSRIRVNTGEYLELEATYEILQTKKVLLNIQSKLRCM